MSNKDKLRKLEEINTELDKRVDPLLMRLATRIAESRYSVWVVVGIVLAIVALAWWVRG